MWVEKHRDTWRIRDRVGGRVVTVKAGFPTKRAAQDRRTTLRSEQLSGSALVVGGGDTTLDAWLDEWWPHHARSMKETAIHSEGGRLRNHIRALLGGYTLDELDSTVIQRWVSYLSDGVPDPAKPDRWLRRPLAPKTVRNCHGLLFTALNAAVAARLLRVNPCAGTRLPARMNREMRFLTDPEIARLLEATPEHWRPLVLLLLATGLRWGEAIGLKAGRVDLLAKTPKLRVEEQLQERSGGGTDLYFTSPKSARSRRTVTFTRTAALALAGLVAGKGRDEMVFTTPTGLMVRTRNFRRVWLKACAAAGLEGLRVHDLRHSHAAILLSAGHSITAVSRRLGHSSVAVTDLIYGHLRVDHDEGLLAAIDAALPSLDATDVDSEVRGELADL